MEFITEISHGHTPNPVQSSVAHANICFKWESNQRPATPKPIR